MRTQAQVDEAIVKHVRTYWRRHRDVLGWEPKTLSFEGELGDLCAELTAAEADLATLLDFIATPGTGTR